MPENKVFIDYANLPTPSEGFLATLFIPFETRMIPLYLFVRDLHINNTYWALILPFLAGGFGTFLMRQTISGIPDELVEAARTHRHERQPLETRPIPRHLGIPRQWRIP